MKLIKIITFVLFPFIVSSSFADLKPEIAELLKNPETAAQFAEFIKQKAPDSIRANFAASGKGFVDGVHGVGLGLSRLVRDCSENFATVGQSLAKHYWILGGVLAGSAFFYWYILPKLNIRVEYKSDAHPAVTHSHHLR